MSYWLFARIWFFEILSNFSCLEFSVLPSSQNKIQKILSDSKSHMMWKRKMSQDQWSNSHGCSINISRDLVLQSLSPNFPSAVDSLKTRKFFTSDIFKSGPREWGSAGNDKITLGFRKNWKFFIQSVIYGSFGPMTKTSKFCFFKITCEVKEKDMIRLII